MISFDIVNKISQAIQEIQSLTCLKSYQTGLARPSEYLNISQGYSKKFEKRLENLKKNLDHQMALLQQFIKKLNKFSFILSIKPADIKKKYENEVKVDVLENEISTLQRYKIEISEILQKSGIKIGI